MAEQASEQNIRTLKIGVRTLIETLYRKGGLSVLSYSNLSANTGTRTHQAFSHFLKEEYRHYEVISECSLQTNVSIENTMDSFIQNLEIRGRADIILLPIEDERIVSFLDFNEKIKDPCVVEVKTVMNKIEFIPDEGEEIHWHQARMYAYMFYATKLEKNLEIPSSIPYALAYVSAEDLQTHFLYRQESFSDLKTWFEESVQNYIKQVQNLEKWKKTRDLSIKQMNFPYKQLREGQKHLIQEVYSSIAKLTPLLAQAPTGIGKTMSVLYPSLKQLPSQIFSHIFYLTAKTSTRQVAESAIRDLRDHSELQIRSITLAPKESMCLAPELYCDTAICPYATAYYDNLQKAIDELWPILEIKPELLKQYGKKYRLCPFELSLDISLYTDVIIGDYNHAFDPKVQLERFFMDNNGNHHILLLDEAHNLVDRSREMYSATIDESDIRAIYNLLPESNHYTRRLTEDVLEYFETLRVGMAKNLLTWDELEKRETREKDIRVLSQENFRAMTEAPLNLSEKLLVWIQNIREYIDQMSNPKERRKLIEVIGQSKFFIRVTEELWSKAFIACARVFNNSLVIRLICLNVSEKLSETYMNKHAAVFFSATLDPISYFSMNFCGKNMDNRPNTLRLASPFPSENLEVYIADYISTTYKNRNQSITDLAKAIALVILLRREQQFIFFPSFSYLESVLPYLQKILKGQNIDWQIQKRRMTTEQRNGFLRAFESPKQDKTVVGFAVLGGIFGEGIDLIGDKLTAVQIVGVGLPQMSPERNIMREYYDEEYHAGFPFAYQYPGINKVLQAAGRLIRSEEDKGIIVLYDERYKTPSYRELLPDYWNPQYVSTIQELKDHLSQDESL